MSLRLSKDVPVGAKRMLADIRAVARKNGVKLYFSKKERIKCDNVFVSGYFDDIKKVVAVSQFNDFTKFISMLAHESSHMDQWIEDKFLWKKCSIGYTTFFEWLDGKEGFSKDILEESVQDIIRLELDCEKRAIRKLKKYKVPIDIDMYIRKMNCYLYGYLFFLEKRIWIQGIYNDEFVTASAPKTVKSSYKKIPARLRKAFEQKLKEHKKAV